MFLWWVGSWPTVPTPNLGDQDFLSGCKATRSVTLDRGPYRVLSAGVSRTFFFRLLLFPLLLSQPGLGPAMAVKLSGSVFWCKWSRNPLIGFIQLQPLRQTPYRFLSECSCHFFRPALWIWNASQINRVIVTKKPVQSTLMPGKQGSGTPFRLASFWESFRDGVLSRFVTIPLRVIIHC
jgi:hypothetical protein